MSKLTAYNNPLTTPTPTLLRRVDIRAIGLHSRVRGSYTSAEFNPVEPSKPPTYDIKNIDFNLKRKKEKCHKYFLVNIFQF